MAGWTVAFRAEHDISRKPFYELRNRAKSEGPAAVLEPPTRRPRSRPSELTDELKTQAIQVCAALEAAGLGAGTFWLNGVHYEWADSTASAAS